MFNRDILDAAGFAKFRERKYLAPVAGVAQEPLLELPDGVNEELRTDGYNTERARIAAPGDETLGLYSGVMVEVAPRQELGRGVNVPPTTELVETTTRLVSDSSEYLAVEQEDEAARVVITFADDDPVAAAALRFEVVDRDGTTTWVDRA